MVRYEEVADCFHSSEEEGDHQTIESLMKIGVDLRGYTLRSCCIEYLTRCGIFSNSRTATIVSTKIKKCLEVTVRLPDGRDNYWLICPRDLHGHGYINFRILE